MPDQIQEQIQEHQKTTEKMLKKSFIRKIEKSVEWIIEAYKNNKKTLWAGNGGSSSDCLHAVGEFVGRFKMERKALPALTLGSEMATNTAISNDYGFEKIFLRSLEALGQKGDVLIGLSTSGNSENIIQAFQRAKHLGIKTIALLGKDGGKLKNLADLEITVPSFDTPRIQEMHIMIIHIICDSVEKELFS